MADRKVEVSGEQLAKFIESAFNQMNVQQLKKRTDANSFDICGLNPYSDDLTAFHKHLDSIEENKCYAAMIEKRSALEDYTLYINRATPLPSIDRKGIFANSINNSNASSVTTNRFHCFASNSALQFDILCFKIPKTSITSIMQTETNLA